MKPRLVIIAKRKRALVAQKYDVLLPCNTKEARELDKIKNDTYWADAINKELSAI